MTAVPYKLQANSKQLGSLSDIVAQTLQIERALALELECARRHWPTIRGALICSPKPLIVAPLRAIVLSRSRLFACAQLGLTLARANPRARYHRFSSVITSPPPPPPMALANRISCHFARAKTMARVATFCAGADQSPPVASKLKKPVATSDTSTASARKCPSSARSLAPISSFCAQASSQDYCAPRANASAVWQDTHVKVCFAERKCVLNARNLSSRR